MLTAQKIAEVFCRHEIETNLHWLKRFVATDADSSSFLGLIVPVAMQGITQLPEDLRSLPLSAIICYIVED